ncbi:MAG: hypothetical protein JXQ75_21655 [Phycisphaerae bacterium]|nr:hypothetical protein [Phycisphaerae bacterium]
MAIAVNCRCGKKFKVKDHMAGKKVRCPQCKAPLQIPVATGGSGVPARPTKADAPSPRISKEEKEQALARFDAAQKRKQLSAEEEAARREERNKLIEGYDQSVGRKDKEKKKKGELAPGKRRKPGIFAKLADAGGVVRSTLIFKYIFVVVLLSGAVVASVFGVRWATSYMQEETGPAPPKDERIAALFEKAEAAIKAKQWSKARDALDEILRLDPRKEVHRDYIRLKKALEAGVKEH